MNDLIILELINKTETIFKEMSLTLVEFLYDESTMYFEVRDELDIDKTSYKFNTPITNITTIDQEVIAKLILKPLFDKIVPDKKTIPTVNYTDLFMPIDLNYQNINLTWNNTQDIQIKIPPAVTVPLSWYKTYDSLSNSTSLSRTAGGYKNYSDLIQFING